MNLGFYTFKKKEDCSLKWNTMIALKALIFKLCSMKPQRARGLCVWPLCVVFGMWCICMWFGVLYMCIYVQYVCRVWNVCVDVWCGVYHACSVCLWDLCVCVWLYMGVVWGRVCADMSRHDEQLWAASCSFNQSSFFTTCGYQVRQE